MSRFAVGKLLGSKYAYRAVSIIVKCWLAQILTAPTILIVLSTNTKHKPQGLKFKVSTKLGN